MAKKPETIFKERILPKLQALGWVTKIQQVAKRGDPDFLLCIKGKFVALELKNDDTYLEPLQRHTLTKISNNGGIALEVYPANWERVYSMLLVMAQGD